MEDRLREKRALVKGTLVDCPFGTPLTDCPANGIRSLTLTQFVSAINRMSEAKLDAIMNYHEHCLRKRDAGARAGG